MRATTGLRASLATRVQLMAMVFCAIGSGAAYDLPPALLHQAPKDKVPNPEIQAKAQAKRDRKARR